MAKDEDPHEDGLIHDEVEIEDFVYDPDKETFTYPCPCGDEFVVTKDELLDGEKYARCPSCSLMVLVIYTLNDLESIVDTKSTHKESKMTNSAMRATN